MQSACWGQAWKVCSNLLGTVQAFISADLHDFAGAPCTPTAAHELAPPKVSKCLLQSGLSGAPRATVSEKNNCARKHSSISG